MNTLSSSDTDQTRTEAVLTAHDCDWSIDPDWSDELQNLIWTLGDFIEKMFGA
jgi:hypothetical protein